MTVGFFAPISILKHVPRLPKKNSSQCSCMDVNFNKSSPKRSCTLSLPTMVPLKEILCYNDEEVNEREEGSNQFDPPPIFDCYGDGGSSMEPHHEPQGNPVSPSLCSKVKEKVQALIHQLSTSPGLTSMHKPGFVYLLETEPEEVISCTPHSDQA